MSTAIRVLHVLGGLNRGGAETLIMNIYRNIDRDKVQFDFVIHTTEHSDYEEEIKSLGGTIHRMERYQGFNHFRYKKKWVNFFEKNSQYNIVHGHMRSTAAIYLKVAKSYSRVAIAHSHNSSSGFGLSAIVKDMMQLPIRYIADHLFACSEKAGKWLFGKKVTSKSNYRQLNNAIDVEKYRFNSCQREYVRKELGIEDKFIIGHVGRFTAQKNHKFLLKIFIEIAKINNNAILMLIGDGELKKEIERDVKQLGLENKVIFIGVVQDVYKYMQGMDVFVFPSHFEGLGIVLIEAQAAGLHCVVADTIPKEAILTDLVNLLSLKDTATSWAREVLKVQGYARKDKTLEIDQKGYSIIELASFLENFYISIHNRQL